MLKGGLGKGRRAGFGVCNSSRVSMSDLLNCEMVLYSVVAELASESMLDGLLVYVDSGYGGKSKSGRIGMWR